MKGIERESERESKIIVKSPKPRNKAQTKVDYTKLSLAIISRNYQLVYYYTKLCREIISYYIISLKSELIIGILAYPKIVV